MSVATSGVLFTKIPHIAALMRTTALLALAEWGGELQSTPKNQAHGVVLRNKCAGRNLLIHRHKSKHFDFAAAMTITAPSRSPKGRDLETHLIAERVRFLR